VNLEPGETLLEVAVVESDDNGHFARLYVTDRRVIIEYPSTIEAVSALAKSALHGDRPLPLPLHLPWGQIARVQSIVRFGGPPLLKIVDESGRASLWKTPKALELAGMIEQAKQAGRLPTA
jgi:hypothetical protein